MRLFYTRILIRVILEREKGTRVVELSSHMCSSFPSSFLSSVVALYLMAKTLTSVQNGANPYKKFLPQNKKRRKKTQDTVYSAMSSIPSGGPPGGTHTQELWYSLRGIDARLESVLSTDKCLCDACCARSQPLILFFFFSSCFGANFFCTDKHHFVRT